LVEISLASMARFSAPEVAQLLETCE